MPKIPTQKFTTAQLRKKIDEMGAIKARIAELNEEFNTIKQELAEAGIEEAEGKLFKYSCSEVVTKRVDWKAVTDEFDIPDSVFRKHTSTSVSYRVSVRSR